MPRIYIFKCGSKCFCCFVEPLAVMPQETQSGENKNDSYHTTHYDDGNGEGRTIISNGLLFIII